MFSNNNICNNNYSSSPTQAYNYYTNMNSLSSNTNVKSQNQFLYIQPIQTQCMQNEECIPALDLPAIPTLFITESIIKGNIKRRKFIKEEDQRLLKLVEHFGTKSWTTIAKYMPLRNERQCKERFLTYLSPELNLNNWTREEDELLLQKYEEIGPKWVQISKFFVGRSDNNLKNRWYTHLRKQTDVSFFVGTSSESGTDSEPENEIKEPNSSPIVIEDKEDNDSMFFEEINLTEEDPNFFDFNANFVFP